MKKGVLLFNLGGPETVDEVRPFLYNLFSDPGIIRIKRNTLRKLLAWFISSVRYRKSQNLYRQIGGGSPLRRITEEQAAALEKRLQDTGSPARVYVGMRCWNPTIDAAVERILQDGIAELVLLPLFPQYSVTTTGSCLEYFGSLQDKLRLGERLEISTVESWFDEPLYLASIEGTIRRALDRFSAGPQDAVHILYSAHSLPRKYISGGDPFLQQTRETVSLVNARLGNAHPSTLAFQSKVGPVKWLGPSTENVLKGLGAKGVDKVLVVPISFVSDHIETLQEIDIAYRNLALQAGIGEFHRADSLNLHPEFIDALAVIASRK